jgi:hypothetical protein
LGENQLGRLCDYPLQRFILSLDLCGVAFSVQRGIAKAAVLHAISVVVQQSILFIL